MADGHAAYPPEGPDPADYASEPTDGNCEPGELGPGADPVPVVLASPDHPELAFVQAKSYAKGRPDGPPLWIVVHDMEASETSTRAENTAQYFASLPDGRSVSSHYCLAPDVRVLYGDLTWRPIGDAEPNDRLVGFDEFPAGPGHTRKLRESRVTKVSRRLSDCLAIELEDGRRVVCSMDHRWLGQKSRLTSGWKTNQQWHPAESLAVGDRIKAPLQPWVVGDDRRTGYVAGILDGEGCFTGDGGLSFAQKPGVVLDVTKQALGELGIPFITTESRQSGVTIVRISGLDGTLRLAGSTRPARLLEDRLWVGKEMKSRLHETTLRIASIEHVGVRELVSIETTTATFFAEGMASHNCADSNSVVQCVRLADTAFTVGNRPGNYRGINWEFSGFASQTREQWLDPFGVAMFDQAAPIIRSDAQRYAIPLVRRTVAELRSYIPGVTSHNDLREAFGNTTHTDPGPNFPWDYFMDLINQVDDAEDEDMARLTFFLADGGYWRSNGTTIRQIRNGSDFKQVADRGDCFPDQDANGFPTPDIILDPERGGWTWEQIKLAYGEDEAVLTGTGMRIEVAGPVTVTDTRHGWLAADPSAPVQRTVAE